MRLGEVCGWVREAWGEGDGGENVGEDLGVLTGEMALVGKRFDGMFEWER